MLFSTQTDFECPPLLPSQTSPSAAQVHTSPPGFPAFLLPASFLVPCFPLLRALSTFPPSFFLSAALSSCVTFPTLPFSVPLSPALFPSLLIPLLFFFLLIHLLRPPRSLPFGTSVLTFCFLPHFLLVQGRKR